jgi:hypothetical protein
MSTINAGLGRLLAGAGGVLLIASLFMPWAAAGGATRTGWETLQIWDVFAAITGICGVVAALTGGRFGFFRPDLSFNAMTDIFGVVLTVLVVWFLADFPAGADPRIGAYLALAGAAVVATGAGDFRVTSVFPRVPEPERPRDAGSSSRK